ncbi:TOPRIM nucleotidyl transferase/hydrolase domain-containing protein [Asticcacaulis sp. AND118]|uniref:TOPRIM nucleotidyl transferase/hydrolase domain-containing protein n=1 Tax=Asticcacaulis sp. AND118 TaxID=2840468 RepID=UPI001CFFFCF5|nr:TOPRIM nucleotidyl transferase/hydrolase domain-containing protein [Asticcacaulis sp. AND118]UDF04994.1 hypothetical protein LH365_16505 [Asticcacaulis sp. AND118]
MALFGLETDRDHDFIGASNAAGKSALLHALPKLLGVTRAANGYPDLHFARFILLFEGDSERIVLPEVARALELLVDTAFVATVPLGGGRGGSAR